MQPQNKIEEWDAIDLLSCSMWKIIFILQANSYSSFWNNSIRGGEPSLCFWILLWLLPWSTTLRLHEKQSGIPLVCLQLSHLDLGTSERLRWHVFGVWAGCISGMKWSFKAACLSVQNLQFHLDFWSVLAKCLCACSGSMKCSWAPKSVGSLPSPAQCWCLVFFSKAQPVLNVKLVRRSCACMPQTS